MAPGSFDFYVLALSWSPGFCASGGAAKSPDQCAAGANPGFVVHGLWPQNQHGYPQACNSGARFPSRLALDSAKGVYPDEGLARHEWRQHGTCSGKSPTDYFADVRRARQAIVIPPELTAPDADQTWAPLDIARSFVTANPRLRTDTMAVTCRGNALEEVRICFSKDLRSFVPCPEVARASCRRPVTVPAGH
ncbi:ribonuclease T2 [Hyphomicrobiales bacterium BP6-180914]|uniref:Ribonuclease T2 n=1 Tax=Lichenifustis flavocetrariae TaxID=2949735 RepID=A0AA42CGQ0_9HYPH|nr:ribonuclease T2 [Lichenifustis flavocetrariae]MCW6506439.1 ribonuclease T2 [Lichenifustis flavocetrariae]